MIINANTGQILYSKNPHLRLPPASTTKVMTVYLALKHLPLNAKVRISRNARNAAPSRADLTLGAVYTVQDLATACLVSSSNDAAVALAEAVSGNERSFSELMNERAEELGMHNTHFVNATGLPLKSRGKTVKQYSTAYDLARLMWYASRDRQADRMMGIVETTITGSDGRVLPLKSHNKMHWRMPNLIKGKTGWTLASRHTFMGTDFAAHKTYTFAMLSSTKPWTDIERLAVFGMSMTSRRSY